MRRPWGTVSFDPSALGPIMRLHADLGITLNGSDVSAWADQVGSYDATQGSAPAQPVYGSDAKGNYVESDGVAEILSADTLAAVFSGTSPVGTLAVCATDHTATFHVACGNTGTNVPLLIVGETNVYRRNDANLNVQIDFTGADYGGYAISSFSPPTNSTLLAAQSGDLSGACLTGAITFDTFTIGGLRRAAINYGAARFREILAWDRALTAGELAAVAQYFAQEWNL